MAQVFEDFSSYSTGNITGVASPPWTVQAAGSGDWSQQIDEEAGSTGNRIARIQRGTSAASSNIVVHDTVGGTTGDIEVVARLKVAASADMVTAYGPLLVASTNASYACNRQTATTVRLMRTGTTAGQAAAIGSDMTFTVPDLEYYWVRIGRSGTTVRAKVWADGGEEPASWMASGTDSTLTTVKAGFGTRAIQRSPMIIDRYGIGTGGDSAPPAEPGEPPPPPPAAGQIIISKRRIVFRR